MERSVDSPKWRMDKLEAFMVERQGDPKDPREVFYSADRTRRHSAVFTSTGSQAIWPDQGCTSLVDNGFV